jgi:hypothetical protein
VRLEFCRLFEVAGWVPSACGLKHRREVLDGKILLTAETKIFAKNPRTGEVIEISNNLYFFEEEGICDLSGEDMYGDKWEIWIEVPSTD